MFELPTLLENNGNTAHSATYFWQINVDIEIMIEEIIILLRIEQLQQSWWWVALETFADFVDLNTKGMTLI